MQKNQKEKLDAEIQRFNIRTERWCEVGLMKQPGIEKNEAGCACSDWVDNVPLLNTLVNSGQEYQGHLSVSVPGVGNPWPEPQASMMKPYYKRTNHRLRDDNVAPIVRSGRARWKTENENHNTLKHQGYHLEHNFGHGEQHLACFLLALNLLAFLLHTSLSLTDATYQGIRQALGRRTTFFDDIRTLTRYLYFDSWLSLITFMFTRLELGPPPDHLPQADFAS